MDEKNIKRFFNGSWNTFTLKLREDGIYTPPVIHKNIKEEFQKNYKVIMESFAYDDLICLFLLLEERNKKKNAKYINHTKFKVAISVEDSLLFCHRTISDKYRKIFIEGLHVDELMPYDLTGSHPTQLLLFYRQARDNYSMFVEHQCLKQPESEIISIDILEKLGTEDMPLPQIRKLTFDLHDVPLRVEAAKTDINMKEVNVSMTGKSILDYYTDMTNSGVISSVPLWLANSRSKGKTHRTLRYN